MNPQGQSTTYYFRYGTTTSYGRRPVRPAPAPAPGRWASTRRINGLTADTIYHYQLVAQNAGGTSFGTDQTVTTTSSQAVVLGHEGFVSPGWVVGVELGCFHGTTRAVVTSR